MGPFPSAIASLIQSLRFRVWARNGEVTDAGCCFLAFLAAFLAGTISMPTERGAVLKGSWDLVTGVYKYGNCTYNYL